jgi:hypothetical protein
MVLKLENENIDNAVQEMISRTGRAKLHILPPENVHDGKKASAEKIPLQVLFGGGNVIQDDWLCHSDLVHNPICNLCILLL